MLNHSYIDFNGLQKCGNIALFNSYQSAGSFITRYECLALSVPFPFRTFLTKSRPFHPEPCDISSIGWQLRDCVCVCVSALKGKGKVTRRGTLEMSVHSTLNLEWVRIKEALLVSLRGCARAFQFKADVIVNTKPSRVHLPYRRGLKDGHSCEWEVPLFIKVFCFSGKKHIMASHLDCVAVGRIGLFIAVLVHLLHIRSWGEGGISSLSSSPIRCNNCRNSIGTKETSLLWFLWVLLWITCQPLQCLWHE